MNKFSPKVFPAVSSKFFTFSGSKSGLANSLLPEAVEYFSLLVASLKASA